jgi:hypothetical protein
MGVNQLTVDREGFAPDWAIRQAVHDFRTLHRKAENSARGSNSLGAPGARIALNWALACPAPMTFRGASCTKLS